jgi:hypothetical protein
MDLIRANANDPAGSCALANRQVMGDADFVHPQLTPSAHFALLHQ